MSVYINGGANVGVNGVIDSSNLHLKKELTQIRKAARVLRDPGTLSSWHSPINSARSLTKHLYVPLYNNGQIDGSNATSEQHSNTSKFTLRNPEGNDTSDRDNAKAKERKVFLYNWGHQKSESKRNDHFGDKVVQKSKPEQSQSVDLDSLSDARNNDGGNDSISDAYTNNRDASAIFKCKDADFTPSIRRTIKKKPKRNRYASSRSKHRNKKFPKQVLLSRSKKSVVGGQPNLGSELDDLLSSVDQSDDADGYCNFEGLRRISAASPLLAKLRNNGWTNSPTKLLRSHKKDDDSLSYSTPTLSTSSYHIYGVRNPSIVESWDATTGSIHAADDEADDCFDFPGRNGCGIPCYWSRRSTPKSGTGRGSCSPSLSDTLKRNGGSILCGSLSMYPRKYHRSSLNSNKRRLMSSRAVTQGLAPLLTNSGDGLEDSSTGSEHSDNDEIKNLSEIDLEALNRLDGKRWSTSVRSQEGSDPVALNSVSHDGSSPENMRSLSHKYRPMFFDELVGQNIVVQSLRSAVLRGRIAPVYLFQGPRGTGKTSTARIFAAAMNCLASEETKPCGICRECADFISGKSVCIKELDGSKKNGIEKSILKSVSQVHPSDAPRLKVFVVNECHLLPSNTWLAFLRLLEKPLSRVVFILETSDSDNIPHTVLARCQKHLFSKISDDDVITRLKNISSQENLDVDPLALDLIASNADGSLRDAETMIDQLSLFGKRITISLVNELIGVVSDERLLDLLELAMSSNATETVVKARELMGSGVEPMLLMSQMATLILDIIAGTHDAKHDSFFSGRSLSERELERLKHALGLLSEAEKHLSNSTERSTWFTATLLQLGSMPSPCRTHSGSSRRQSSKTTEEDHREASAHKPRRDVLLANDKSASPKSSLSWAGHRNSLSNDYQVSPARPSGFNYNFNQGQLVNGGVLVRPHDDNDGKEGITYGRCMNSNMLIDVWLQCIEKCHSSTLRELLRSYGRLLSVSEVKGDFVAYVAFEDRKIKTRAEGFLSSITNSFEVVLQRNIEVKLITLPDCSGQKLTPSHTPVDDSDDNSHKKQQPSDSIVENANIENVKSVIPVQRIKSIIREQRLETAWLQELEKDTRGSISGLRPERNQVLPQDGAFDGNQMETKNSAASSPMQHWEDELNIEIKALNISHAREKNEVAKMGDHRYPISPSLLHTGSYASNYNKDNMGYESGSGTARCSGMFCWNTARNQRRPKAIPGTTLHPPPKSGRFLWFGECARTRRSDNRHNV